MAQHQPRPVGIIGIILDHLEPFPLAGFVSFVP